jgi:hypothetical protein
MGRDTATRRFARTLCVVTARVTRTGAAADTATTTATAGKAATAGAWRTLRAQGVQHG